MSDVVIREIGEEDLPALKSLIVEAFGKGWNLGRFDQSGDFFAALLDVYLSIFLEPSTFGKVAVMGDEVVGATLCSVRGEPEIFRRLLSGTAPNTLVLLSAEETERADIVEHLSVSFQTIGRLLESRADAYGGSLEFISVSQRAQGLKIGKALWEQARAYYISKGAKHIYLISDSACNTGFYDHNGFCRTGAEEAVYNYTAGQRRLRVFVYEYEF